MSVPDEIVEHYSLGGESERLRTGPGRLEFLRTQELVRRYLPPAPASVLDVGGGPGHYAAWLAELGYAVHVVEPVPLHVERAAARGAGRPELAITASLADARQLEAAQSSVDAVLPLGPLYHLTAREDRIRALQEAARVVRAGGPILVAVISRFASLLDGFRLGFIDRPDSFSMIERDLREGQHRNPTGTPAWFTTAYFHHPDEIAEEFRLAGVILVEVLGIEGPGWLFPDLQERLDDPDRRENVLAAARMVETEPRMIGMSGHILAVGRG